MGVPLFTTECPQGVYQIAFEITEDMINETGRMSIGALARQMQHITVCVVKLFPEYISTAGKNFFGRISKGREMPRLPTGAGV